MMTSNMNDKKPEVPPCPPGGMTVEEYRVRAKEMVDYIADYLQTIRDRRVFPDVQPGYMRNLLPDHAPSRPDKWNDIFADVERVIMPGVTHWQSPYFHAYFPVNNSYPALLGDMLCNAISCIGFTWASSPACTELETVVMDWLGKMIGLPDCFMHNSKDGKSKGGGCLQTTGSESNFVTLLAARTAAIRRHKENQPDMEDIEINGRLVAYCSDQAHSSVEKAGLLGLVKMRLLQPDEHLSMRGETLERAIREDKEKGLIPFYVCATLGTTGVGGFDNLLELGPICEREHLWLHVDAAYAGSAFVCPEYRKWMAGIEYVDSFAMNPSKGLMIHFDCNSLWLKDARALHNAFSVQPLYLQHENSGTEIDFRHWQIGLSRRFRSLKLWFAMRTFGVEGLQAHVRRVARLAAKFEDLVRADERFEIPVPRVFGLVVFRMVGADDLNQDLLARLNKQGEVFMVPTTVKGKFVLRFVVSTQFTTDADIERDWQIIADMATVVLQHTENTAERTNAQESGDARETSTNMVNGDVGGL